MTDEWSEIGPYLISTACHKEGLICRHECKHKETGVIRTYTGSVIYFVLKKRGLSLAHFDQYSLDVRNNMDLIALANSLV